MKIWMIFASCYLLYCLPCHAQLELSDSSGVIRPAIDWYIETTIHAVDSLNPGAKVKSIEMFGILTLYLLSKPDTIVRTDVGGIVGLGQTRFQRFEFIITQRPRQWIVSFLPSFWFVHKGHKIAVYTGMEEYLAPDKKLSRKIERSLPRTEYAWVKGMREYVIVTDEYSKTFKKREYEQPR